MIFENIRNEIIFVITRCLQGYFVFDDLISYLFCLKEQ